MTVILASIFVISKPVFQPRSNITCKPSNLCGALSDIQLFQIALTAILVLFLHSPASAQTEADSASFDTKRFVPAIAAGSVLAGSSLIALHTTWYSEFEQEKFHLFRDGKQWLQMDKVGHGCTAYYVGMFCGRGLSWTGVEKKKAVIAGGSIGLGYLTAIELMDGFSNEWGFSLGDMAANIGGTGLYVAQELAWEEQRIQLKYNFIPSQYASYRPSTLGVGFFPQALKDYNGQAYWLVTNPSYWKSSSSWPRWFNLALGYSADGMTGGTSNVFPLVDSNDPTPTFKRTRQFYLSVDIDLFQIEAKRNWFRALRSFVGFVKIPAPAIGINSQGNLLFEIR